MRVNYHTHTKRCKHAGGNEEDYVIEAINKGFDIIGISDHAAFPDKDYGYRMEYSELNDYLMAVDEAKNKYSDKIKVLKSLEIEYMPKYRDFYEELLEKKKLDYLLLGQHFYINSKKEFHNITSVDSTNHYVDYANSIKEALDTGYFKIVAHPDLFCINPYSWDINSDRATDIIVDAVVKNNAIIEYNANGLRRDIVKAEDGDRYPYPHINLWKKVKESGARVIVGSDCHNPKVLWDEYMDKAYENLSELGIKPVFEL